jgi:hypothetical protein
VVLLLLVARRLVFDLLDAPSAFLVNMSLMGELLILSGPLLLHHFRSFPYEDRVRGEWTGTELFYTIVFFIALFVFAISVASLVLSG